MSEETMPARPEFTVDEALRIADQNADTYDKVASVSRTLAAEVRRLQAAQPLPSDWVAVPHQECYSENFDTWFDSPDDSAFVDGLKVGDTYKLQVSHYSIEREYVVTKVPDVTNDDYEVAPVKAAPSAPAEGGEDGKPDTWTKDQSDASAMYDAAAKGFHTSETNGAESRYVHVIKFRSIEDLHAYEEAWTAAMVKVRDSRD